MSTLERTERLLWLCLLLFVPISASPFLPFGSGTLVRPLAIVPAALLLVFAGFRIALLGQTPRFADNKDGLVLLLLFAAYVVISGLARISFLPEEPFKGQTPLGSFIRALVTLAAGMSFYVVGRLHIRTAADARLAIRYLFIGMTASIVFAVIQVIAMVQQGQTLRIVQAITDVFAIHYDGLYSRAQGMTFEPSWLATQIIVLMIPVLVAGSISRQSFAGTPAGSNHVVGQLGGFAIAITGLLCSGSRSGLAGVVVMLLFGGLMAARRGRLIAMLGFVFALMVGIGGIAVMNSLGAGAGATYVLGPVKYLVSSSVSAENDADPAVNVTDALALAGRVSAAQAAANMWLDHPLFGVSLGNDYRYFGKYAPDWAYTTQLFTQNAREGVGWLDPNSPEKGNAKSLFVRLLAETGLVGFALFAAFFLLQIFREPARDNFHAYFRLASAAALIFGFLNQDTLADPVFWLPLVLCSAMARGADSETQ